MLMLLRYSEGLIRVPLSSVSAPPGNLGGTKGSAGVAVAPPSDTLLLRNFLFLTRSEGLTMVSSSSSDEVRCPNNCSRLVKVGGAVGGSGGGGGAEEGADKLCFKGPEVKTENKS